MSQPTTESTASNPIYAAFVGIDWGDEKHAVSLCADGREQIERLILEQTPEALAEWANGLRVRFPGGKIALCLEQARGALLAGLMQYEHLVLYPINPKSLARFREALFPSRSKDDPVDADLLVDLLVKHRARLRPWQPDTVQTRLLGLLAEDRRGFVDQRTALTNQLLSHLKAIFPQAPELLGPHLWCRLSTDFLKKWPTLQAVQEAAPRSLRAFYYGHNSRSEERLELVKKAVPLTRDEALLGAHSLAIETLAAQLEALRPFIEQYDERIAEIFAAHPDALLFASLPGAGAVLAPRLLCALGTERSRFADAASVQCYSGIAPVTEQSGKSQWVHLRWSCPKFMRQTWHEFANSSRKYSAWAAACYEDLIKRMEHHAAIRKLAYKWQRIIWRMWQERQPYNETRYLTSLHKQGLGPYADVVATPQKSGE